MNRPGIQPVTTRGGDTIIIDDPLNASEAQSELAQGIIEWYGGTLVSGLNNKNTGAIIAVISACTRTTWPVTSCARAIGTVWNCRRWRWTSKPSNSGMEGPICVELAMCCVRNARGRAPSTP